MKICLTIILFSIAGLNTNAVAQDSAQKTVVQFAADAQAHANEDLWADNTMRSVIREYAAAATSLAQAPDVSAETWTQFLQAFAILTTQTRGYYKGVTNDMRINTTLLSPFRQNPVFIATSNAVSEQLLQNLAAETQGFKMDEQNASDQAVKSANMHLHGAIYFFGAQSPTAAQITSLLTSAFKVEYQDKQGTTIMAMRQANLQKKAGFAKGAAAFLKLGFNESSDYVEFIKKGFPSDQ